MGDAVMTGWLKAWKSANFNSAVYAKCIIRAVLRDADRVGGWSWFCKTRIAGNLGDKKRG